MVGSSAQLCAEGAACAGWSGIAIAGPKKKGLRQCGRIYASLSRARRAAAVVPSVAPSWCLIIIRATDGPLRNDLIIYLFILYA